MSNFQNVPSIIKWTGSKRLQAKEIQSYIPENYNRYFEPFLGGASILYNNTHKPSFGNDIYPTLIDFWIIVRDNPTYLIDQYKIEWNNLQNDFPKHYYIIRDRFNKEKDPSDLLFLSRTAVNGIIRFNSKGEFNNSLHLSRKGMHPDKFASIVMQWSKKIEHTQFYNMDYSNFLKMTKKDDFVYLDPPYAGSTNRYVQNLDLEKLLVELELLNKKNVKWALSFDGLNQKNNFTHHIPKHLYKRVVELNIGNSKVSQVLNKNNDPSTDQLYLNY